MKLYAAITKIDEEQRMVWGYASTEALDSQDEVVSRKAMEDAWDDYMKFANIREMHQPSAVGVVKESSFDDKGVFIGAKVVDDVAWKKVKEQVYKGFSIGGRKTGFDKSNKTITGLRLTEISLVDRPANPEALITMFKAEDADVTDKTDVTAETAVEAVEQLAKLLDDGAVTPQYLLELIAKADAEKTPTEQPAEESAKAVDGVTAEDDAEKAAKKPEGEYGDVEYADTKNKKYPIDTDEHIRAAWSYINMPKNQKGYTSKEVKTIKSRIVAAWKEKVDPDGPPAAAKSDLPDALRKATAFLGDADALAKGMYEVSRLAELLQGLCWLQECCASEAASEGDGSTMPARLAEAASELGACLVAMVEEEVGEMFSGRADDVADAVMLAEAIATSPAAGELGKAGRKFSASTSKQLGEVHACMKSACEMLDKLGYMDKDDGEVEAAEPAGDIGKADGGEDRLTKIEQRLAGTVERLAADNARLRKAAESDASALTKLSDELADLRKRFDETPLQPKAVHAGASVTKDDDRGVDKDAVKPVLKEDGTTDDVATMVKMIHQSGGQPIFQ